MTLSMPELPLRFMPSSMRIMARSPSACTSRTGLASPIGAGSVTGVVLSCNRERIGGDHVDVGQPRRAVGGVRRRRACEHLRHVA